MSKLGFAILASFLLVTIADVRFSVGQTSGEDVAFFENKIRPVLVKHCYECHSSDSKEVGGKLYLDSREGVLKGGQSGPALIVGQPRDSLIIAALRHDQLEMPPEQPLAEPVVRDFESWIRRGAVDPRSEESTQRKTAPKSPETLWSFVPRRPPQVPLVHDSAWASDPLDDFVFARIEAAGLVPTRDASAEVLVRRLYYDLLGLPPSVEDVQAFVGDHRVRGARAVESLVDSLLHQPQFGERWGRHWLDVARYGESNGDDGLGRNATFPHAWRYRDYVIDSLNNDLPYNEFLTQQIAGDLLPADSAEQRNRHLVATGFLAIGAKPAAAMNKNFAMDVVDDQINAVSTAVMGLSVACARCHDHKHDPIPTRDYYAMAGIFSSTETLYGLAANEGLTAPPTPLHQLTSVLNQDSQSAQTRQSPVFPEAYSASIDALGPHLHARFDVAPQGLSLESDVPFSAQDFAQVKTANIRGQLSESAESYSVTFWFKNDTDNKARPITAYLFSRAKLGDKALPGDHLGIGGKHDLARSGKLFVFNGNVAKQSIAGETVIPSGTWNHVALVRSGSHVSVFLNGELEIECQMSATFGDSKQFCLATRSDKFAPLVGNVAEFAVFDRALTSDEATKLFTESGQPRRPRTIGLAMGVREKAKPADCKIHVGGETGKLGPQVPRGFPQAYAEAPGESKFAAASEFVIDGKRSGRRELAAWLTHPDHPQTARVIANRVWLHLFGSGIVATPDDFGVYGARPTHPDLLDHLAERLIRDCWSIKGLIRSIVLSRTYQLDSRCDAQLAAADPDNELFARHSRRCLDAESIRDSLLKVSGRLDLRPGMGSAIEKTVALINWPPGEATDLHRDSNHRSVYLCLLRHAPPRQLQPFDFPSGTSVVGKRNETTLPTQSLFLLNSSFVVQQSMRLAGSQLEGKKSDVQNVRAIYRRILQREPTESEVGRATKYVREMAATHWSTVIDKDRRTSKSWASLCQALFASNEFRYID